jgi:hypothetical protein
VTAGVMSVRFVVWLYATVAVLIGLATCAAIALVDWWEDR